MKKKAKLPIPNPVEDAKVLRVEQQQTVTQEETLALNSLRPTVQAALTLMNYTKAFGEISVIALVENLGKQCEMVSEGDLGRAEALLVAQAHTLDAIFHNLARKAAHCEYLNQLEVNLRLALKAQSQCRATLETLAEIRNPMAGAYVRQANIAAGHQQINNENSPSNKPSRAREFAIQQNKLSEGKDELQSDTRAPALESRVDPQMEALGEVNRAKVVSR